jgi:hypothetical protein
MVLSLTELALVNFDGLVRNNNLNRAAFQKDEDDFSAKHAPICHCEATEAILAFDSVGWFAAQDVVCKEHNFAQDEITTLEPRTVLNGRRRIAVGPSRRPPTSPNKSITRA